MPGIFISYRREDTEGVAGRLYDDLVEAFGADSVFMGDERTEPGQDVRRVIEQRIASCSMLLALVGKAWLTLADSEGRRRVDDRNDVVRLEVASALKFDLPVVPVLVHQAGMPRAEQLPPELQDLVYRNCVELTHARWTSDVQSLIRALAPYLAHALPASASSSQPLSASSTSSDALLPLKMLAAIAIAPFTLAWDAMTAVQRWNSNRATRLLLATQAEQPLMFGVSSPERSSAGSEFSLVLMAYVEATRAEAVKQARALGGRSHRQVLDVAPAGSAAWRIGTPLTVRLSGRSFSVEPPEQTVTWNGSQNTIAFAVRTLPEARGLAVLLVLVLVEGVAIASIPLQVEIRKGGNSPLASTKEEACVAPHSLSASYASKDAVEVAGRLSTLLRWAPKLDIFQDCLDLQPNEAYKPQLERQIVARDAFLLFWSRNAANSNWVKWEVETALTKKPRDAILPMPLEDPAIAPPPPELADLHFRDKFLLAGYAAKGLSADRSSAS